MSYLILDIETASIEITNKDIWKYLSEKATVRQLHPVFSKIITIGIKEPNNEPMIIYGDDEKEIIEEFWNKISILEPNVIVTFNGYGFDIPFILVRSSINNVSPTMNINTNKWNMERSNHFDCMLVFSHKGTFLNVAQDIICKTLSIDVLDKIGGKEIEEHYIKKIWEPIKHHCTQDLLLTESLYKKIKGLP